MYTTWLFLDCEQKATVKILGIKKIFIKYCKWQKADEGPVKVKKEDKVSGYLLTRKTNAKFARWSFSEGHIVPTFCSRLIRYSRPGQARQPVGGHTNRLTDMPRDIDTERERKEPGGKRGDPWADQIVCVWIWWALLSGNPATNDSNWSCPGSYTRLFGNRVHSLVALEA